MPILIELIQLGRIEVLKTLTQLRGQPGQGWGRNNISHWISKQELAAAAFAGLRSQFRRDYWHRAGTSLVPSARVGGSGSTSGAFVPFCLVGHSFYFQPNKALAVPEDFGLSW